MSEADECKIEMRAPLLDREWVAESLDVILGGGEGAADRLARLLDTFRHALDGGLSGINEVHAALNEAVELVYLRTGAHASALKLYRLSLEGDLKVEDEPTRLIGAAVARTVSRAGAARAHGRERAKA